MITKMALILSVLLSACGAKKSGHQAPGATFPTTNPTGNGSGESAPPAQQPEGTITSSGGYLYGFETNPWYLQNTTVVKYCVAMDEENFGVSKDTARDQIKEAINSWKAALNIAKYNRYDVGDLKPWREVRLGTQQFEEAGCEASDVSLRFQLGVLTSDQMAIVGNPKRFVANAFQTSYDEVNMRGSGFIYLAPQSGPLEPDEEGKAERFWSEANHFALRFVLMHELGHVFGFPHGPDTIMQEDGPQFVIGKAWLKAVSSDPEASGEVLRHFMNSIFGFSKDAVSPIYKSYSVEFTGRESSEDLALKCDHGSRYGHDVIECGVYESTGSSSGQPVIGKKVGHLDVSSATTGSSAMSQKVKLPPSQAVFELSDDLRNRPFGGPVLYTTVKRYFEVAGDYVSEDGKIKFPMSVRSLEGDPQRLGITAVLNGKLVSIFN